MLSPVIRHNKIKIIFTPNPQYIITAAGQAEKELEEVIVLPQQIQKLVIEKSYDTGLTDLYVYFENMSPTVLANFSDGKYIAYVFIEAAVENQEAGASMLNYFICKDITFLGTTRVLGTYAAVEAKAHLISITRARLEIENNFPYELGGKGSTRGKGLSSAADPGVAPYAFFTSTFSNIFNQNYSDKNGETGIGGIINMPFTEVSGDNLITSGPPKGYLIQCDTNLETIQYLQDHYPMFKTVYTWVLDDFNTSKIGDGTCLFITDLVKWKTWQTHINVELSKIFNEPEGENPLQESLSAYTFLKTTPIHHSPYYNTFRFLVRDKYPKIYAEDISTGEPILMNEWNVLHNMRYMLVASTAGLRVKQMTNPMYKEYLTFMTPEEIGQIQTFQAVFQNLHPEITTYRFENVQIGDVDLNTVIEIKKDSLNSAENYGYNRIGLGYQARHIYTRETLSPAGNIENLNNVEEFFNNDAYTPKFSLVSEVSFLFIDEGPDTIAEYENQGNNVASREVFVSSNDIATLIGLNAESCETGGGMTSGDGGGIPGNASIADQAEHIVKHGGCRYIFGRQCDGVNGVDCSGMVQLAVKRAGADKGYSEGYPRTTTGQRPWCQRHAIPISWENRQRGDILFFDSGKLGHCRHTGVVASKDTFYEAGCSKCGLRERSFKGHRRPCAIFRIKQSPAQQANASNSSNTTDSKKSFEKKS